TSPRLQAPHLLLEACPRTRGIGNMPHQDVSVVIPYYRAISTISRAISSVLAQTVQPLEILVVDDGSSDNVAEELQKFGSAVTLIRKANGGVATARNTGIDHARGEWIAFLDADDYWEPVKLECQLAASEGVDLIGSRWYTEFPGQPRVQRESENESLYGKILR